MHTHIEGDEVFLSWSQVFLEDRRPNFKMELSGIYFNWKGMRSKEIFEDQVTTKPEMGYIRVSVYINSHTRYREVWQFVLAER